MATVRNDRSALRSVVALVSALGLGVLGLLLGSVLLAVVLVALQLRGYELTPALVIVLGLVFVQGVGCAGLALTYLKARPAVGPRIRELLGLAGEPGSFGIGASVPDVRGWLVVVGGYALALGGAMLGGILVSLLPVEAGRNQGAEIGMQNPEVLLVLIPASVLVIGPGEELLFRGVVQGRLREVFGPVPGVVIPSVAFAGLHWFALTGGTVAGNLLAVAVLVVPALVFGASYEYTGNIVVPALIHGVYNATLFTMLYVAVAYGDELSEPALVGAAALA